MIRYHSFYPYVFSLSAHYVRCLSTEIRASLGGIARVHTVT